MDVAQALRLQSEGRTLSAAQRAILAAGHVAARAGESASAIHPLRELVREYPHFAEAQFSVARSYYALGKYPLACAHLRQALGVAPRAGHIELLLGLSLSRADRSHEALATLAHLTDAYPRWPAGWLAQAEVQETLGDARAAWASLKRARTSSPSAPVQLALGRAARRRGEEDAARAHWQLALAWDPSNYDAAFELGILEHDSGRYTEAAALLERAHGLRPRSVEALSNLGNALLAVGNVEQAVHRHEQAVAVRPDLGSCIPNARSLENSGRCFATRRN